jgi:uncharacterized protein (TIGR02757 family)
MTQEDLKGILNKLYEKYNSKAYLCSDPLCFVWDFKKKEDREIVGLVASSLAYGHVQQIKCNVQRILKVLGPHPADFVIRFHPEKWERHLAGFKHRFNTGHDLANLFYFMKQMIDQAGSIEGFFMEGYSSNKDMEHALSSFSKRALVLKRIEDVILQRSRRAGRKRCAGIEFFFSSPVNGSACKRMNLFLRWMVRKDNLDLGIWEDIDKSLLIIPLDTHIANISRRLGWTSRKNPSWKMALDITGALKRIDPKDPVKYDFALCHNEKLREEVF